MHRSHAQDLFDALVTDHRHVIGVVRLEARAVSVGAAVGDTPPLDYSVRVRLRTDDGGDLEKVLGAMRSCAVRLNDNEVVAT